MHINRGVHLRGLQFGGFFSGGLISRGVISGIRTPPPGRRCRSRWQSVYPGVYIQNCVCICFALKCVSVRRRRQCHTNICCHIIVQPRVVLSEQPRQEHTGLELHSYTAAGQQICVRFETTAIIKHLYLRAVGRKVLWSSACVCLCVCVSVRTLLSARPRQHTSIGPMYVGWSEALATLAKCLTNVVNQSISSVLSSPQKWRNIRCSPL